MSIAVTQELVDKVVAKAKVGRYGLGGRTKPMDLALYHPQDIHAMAMILVGGWTHKYDLISIFTAALEVVTEAQCSIITAQDEYIQILADELDELISFAVVHGWKSSRYQAGCDARAKIESLKASALSAPPREPDPS